MQRCKRAINTTCSSRPIIWSNDCWRKSYCNRSTNRSWPIWKNSTRPCWICRSTLIIRILCRIFGAMSGWFIIKQKSTRKSLPSKAMTSCSTPIMPGKSIGTTPNAIVSWWRSKHLASRWIPKAKMKSTKHTIGCSRWTTRWNRRMSPMKSSIICRMVWKILPSYILATPHLY